MIKFKKNGRPNKSEKKLYRDINTFLSNLSEEERSTYDFDNEIVNDQKRLESIWDTLTLSSAKENEKPTLENKEVNLDSMENNTNDKFSEIVKDTDDNIIPTNFNPLADPIQEREYNKIDTQDVGAINEPDFKSNNQFDNLENVAPVLETEEEISQEEEIKEPSAFENITNEGVNQLEGKEKKLAVKQLVETVLDGYAMLHEIAKMKVVYPEEKLQEKIIAGEIDPNDEIPVDEQGTTVSPVEFIQSFNEQAKDAISYDPEFGEQVRPALERVFAKKGWGMTDEQYLIYMFGKDLAFKGVQIMTLRKTANGIMNTFATIQAQKMGSVPTETVRPDSVDRPPQPEPPQENVYQAEDVVSDEPIITEPETIGE